MNDSEGGASGAGRVFAKICGLRTAGDVAAAVAAGADAVGFVLSRSSPRALDPESIAALAAGVPRGTATVLVAHDRPAAEAARMAADAGIDVLQLHGGHYDAAAFAAAAAILPRVWRAVSLAEGPPLAVGALGEEALLLDSPLAGSGDRWDLSALAGRRPVGSWLLAGGLDPSNVAAAIAQAAPWGVDVSSGVESSRGVKDHGLIRAFLAAARGPERAE